MNKRQVTSLCGFTLSVVALASLISLAFFFPDLARGPVLWILMATAIIGIIRHAFYK